MPDPSAGIAASLAKPVRRIQLHDTLAAVLGRAPAAEPSTPAAEDHLSLAGRVLLVEDNRVNQRVAVAVLDKIGMTTEVANNGLEAVVAVGRAPFDLVLMDCQMPEMDGFEATATIRAREQSSGAAHLPIIAMTANAMEGDRERCLEAGMDDYLSKPVKRPDLEAMLRQWLGLRDPNEAEGPRSVRS